MNLSVVTKGHCAILVVNGAMRCALRRMLFGNIFSSVVEILKPVLPVALPDAGFYLWVNLADPKISAPVADTAFAKALYRDYNVTVLPGSYLARTAQGVNPGENFIRLALVYNMKDAVEAARRIAEFTLSAVNSRQLPAINLLLSS